MVRPRGRSRGSLLNTAPRQSDQEANPLRAVSVLRLVTGCPKIDCFSWHCHRVLHEYAELDEGPCKAIVELLAARVEDEDERVDCYAGDWNELRIEEGDGDDLGA